MVTVVHGVDSESADLAGRTMQEVRMLYANVFNMPADATAKVNGKEVGENYVVQDNDKIAFEKKADKHAA